jgi:alkylation response protein AidB-like acyl-CoA dehydrogenase
VPELLPGVIERDEHSKFPTEQVKMMADLGLWKNEVDPKYSGSGLIVFLMFGND